MPYSRNEYLRFDKFSVKSEYDKEIHIWGRFNGSFNKASPNKAFRKASVRTSVSATSVSARHILVRVLDYQPFYIFYLSLEGNITTSQSIYMDVVKRLKLYKKYKNISIKLLYKYPIHGYFENRCPCIEIRCSTDLYSIGIINSFVKIEGAKYKLECKDYKRDKYDWINKLWIELNNNIEYKDGKFNKDILGCLSPILLRQYDTVRKSERLSISHEVIVYWRDIILLDETNNNIPSLSGYRIASWDIESFTAPNINASKFELMKYKIGVPDPNKGTPLYYPPTEDIPSTLCTMISVVCFTSGDDYRKWKRYVITWLNDFRINSVKLKWDNNKTYDVETIACNSELDMYREFEDLLIRENIDIITGQYITAYDFNFIYIRLKKSGYSFSNISRYKDHVIKIRTKEISTNAYSMSLVYPVIPGRMILDILLYTKFQVSLPKYDLNTVAKHYIGSRYNGISKDNVSYLDMWNYTYDLWIDYMKMREHFNSDGTCFKEIDKKELEALWYSYKTSSQVFGDVMKYCVIDSEIVARCVNDASMDITSIEFSNLLFHNIDVVWGASQSTRLSWIRYMIISLAGYFLTSIPKEYNPDIKVKFVGGEVLKPVPCRGEIFTVDFSSLYPSITLAKNIGTNTVIPISLKHRLNPGEYIKVKLDGRKYLILKEKKVKSTQALTNEYFLNIRKKAKNQRKKYKEGSVEYNRFDGKQKASKISGNSVYGFSGAVFDDFYYAPVAALITYFGRQALKRAVKFFESFSYLDIVGGDTDSCFIMFALTEVRTEGNALTEESFPVCTSVSAKVKHIQDLCKEFSNKYKEYKGMIKLELEDLSYTYLTKLKKNRAKVSIWTSDSGWITKDKDIPYDKNGLVKQEHIIIKGMGNMRNRPKIIYDILKEVNICILSQYNFTKINELLDNSIIDLIESIELTNEFSIDDASMVYGIGAKTFNGSSTISTAVSRLSSYGHNINIGDKISLVCTKYDPKNHKSNKIGDRLYSAEEISCSDIKFKICSKYIIGKFNIIFNIIRDVYSVKIEDIIYSNGTKEPGFIITDSIMSYNPITYYNISIDSIF